MKNKVIMTIVCTFLMACNGQKKENVNKPINNKIVMKKLDNSYLNKIKGIKEKIQFNENDTVIELADREGTFFERRRKNNEKLEKRFSYCKNSHLLLAEGIYFYNFPIGIHKEYNKKGELIRERNNDENFPFSVNALIEKIKVTHKIDLNDTTKVSIISRNFDKSFNKYVYDIHYKENINDSPKYIAVDGETGEIVSEGILKINMR
jgi:hypothetical protein